MAVTPPDDLVLYDLLSLVLTPDQMPTVEQVTLWTDHEKQQAETWAGKVHLRASDNHVRVPDRPIFLKG